MFFTVIGPLRDVLLDGFLQSFFRTFIHKVVIEEQNKKGWEGNEADARAKMLIYLLESKLIPQAERK